MPLHPQAKKFLEQLEAAKAAGAKSIEQMPVQENRDGLAGLYQGLVGEPQHVAAVKRKDSS